MDFSQNSQSNTVKDQLPVKDHASVLFKPECNRNYWKHLCVVNRL